MKKTKMKVKKSALKRFKITARGKILHRGHGSRHLRSAKTKRRIRSLKVLKEVKGRFKRLIKKLIGK